MALEFGGHWVDTDECYLFEITTITGDEGACGRMIEWNPMIVRRLHEDNPTMISAKFHNTLAVVIVAIAELERVFEYLEAMGDLGELDVT